MGSRKYQNIVIRGETYPTVQMAAKALSLTEGTICRAIKLERLDTVGLGCAAGWRMPISVRGTVYKNSSEAAEVLGVTRSAIHNALHHGRIDKVGLPSPKRKKGKPFSVGGLSWPSMRSASLELGFGHQYVFRAFKYNRVEAKHKILLAVMKLAKERDAAGSEGGSINVVT